MSIATIVDSVYPAPSGVGIPTGVSITVLFDREVDEESIKNGGLFVTGRDNDTWSGPDLQLLMGAESYGEESEILQSPAYKGIVQGEITFQRIDPLSDTVVTTEDTLASGLLFRTKAIFTPSQRLRENTEYEVFLVGDDDTTDSFKTGLADRTVFDSIASGINTGNGSITLEGTYIGGAPSDIFELTITTAGETGDSKFTFFKHSDLLTVYGPFRTRQGGVLLSDGVTVKFADATYNVGDKFLFRVKSLSNFSGNMWWNFKTGSGSIETIPDDISTSVIGDPVTTSTSTSTDSFSVLSTSPSNESSNVEVDESEFEITVTFDSDIDPTSVASGIGIWAYGESVTGDPSVTASGLLLSTHSVDGDTLTLQIASGQLFYNNLISITVDDTVTNTDGVSLDADYEFWFTTSYSPLYCNTRRLRVMIGAYIENFKDDTLNLAIHLASIEADALTWNKANLTDEYYMFARSQWTCCRAAQILLVNANASDGRLKSKRLGDLEVAYDTSRAGVQEPLKRADMCVEKWEGVLLAGGRQVQTASPVIKGEYDPDRPNIGRSWYRDSAAKTPGANQRIRLFGQRRFGKGWWNR